jgi:hypothetical protein
MQGIRRRALTLLAGSLLFATTGALPAAAAETTPPRLSLLPFASFPVGGQISGSGPPPHTEENWGYTRVPFFIKWTGRDASGICGYDVYDVWFGGEPELVASGTQWMRRFNGSNDDYDGSYGGGSNSSYGWDVVARDCAGNTTTRFAQARPSVTQEDGYNVTAFPGSPSPISYSGTWQRASCTCWSGGSVQWTKQQGARARLTADYRAKGAVALVMEKAPNRGKFTLVIDGVARATIDTYAPVATHRVIVWSGHMTAGRHVIELVNQATSGRPRIDLDAVLLNT